jgi:hypothetical protein
MVIESFFRDAQQAAADLQRRANDAKFAQRLLAKGVNPYRSTEPETLVDAATGGAIYEDRGPPLINSRLFNAQFAASLVPLKKQIEAFEAAHKPENIAFITIRPSQAKNSKTGRLLDKAGNLPLRNLGEGHRAASDDMQRALEELVRRELLVPLLVGRHADPVGGGAAFAWHGHVTVDMHPDNAPAVDEFLKERFGENRVWVSSKKHPEEKRSLVATLYYPASELANRSYDDISDDHIKEFFEQSRGLRRIESLGPLRNFRAQERKDAAGVPFAEYEQSDEMESESDCGKVVEAGEGRTQSTASQTNEQVGQELFEPAEKPGTAAEAPPTKGNDAHAAPPDSIPARPMARLVRVHNADSDEVARVKRDEAARDSWMMSPAVTE